MGKIAFPEFVARVNHCDRHSHRNSSHCTTEIDGTAVSDYLTNTENGNPDTAGASDGINKLSAYPGYANSLPHRRLGFQDIIIDGVTMKKTDNQYDSRNDRGTAENKMCGTDYYENEVINMDKAIKFFGANDSTVD